MLFSLSNKKLLRFLNTSRLERSRPSLAKRGDFLQASLSKILGSIHFGFHVNVTRLGFPINASDFARAIRLWLARSLAAQASRAESQAKARHCHLDDTGESSTRSSDRRCGPQLDAQQGYSEKDQPRDNECASRERPPRPHFTSSVRSEGNCEEEGSEPGSVSGGRRSPCPQGDGDLGPANRQLVYCGRTDLVRDVYATANETRLPTIVSAPTSVRMIQLAFFMFASDRLKVVALANSHKLRRVRIDPL